MDLQTQKYIRFRDFKGQGDQIITFDGTLMHSDMAKLIGGTPMSAGFVRLEIEDGEPRYVCFGKSIGLSLGARFDDSEILNFQLRQWHI